jgi:tRNA G10  N-methylase Trm11
MSLKDDFQLTGTPLEVDFRSLVDWVKLGDQFTHQIHPYPAKLIPHIANFFIRSSVFFQQEKVVLDPFCGSGTVALEASLAGCLPYVADANPLALLITKVKTKNYDSAYLTDVLQQIARKCKRYKSAPEIAIVNSHLWYSSERKKALELILRAVMDIEEVEIRDFFRICFSVTARRFSNADPAISVPVRLKTRPTFSDVTNARISSRLTWIEEASPLGEFVKVSLSNIDRVTAANYALPSRQSAQIISNDARNLSSNDFLQDSGSQVPLIVTSPPYGSAQKYIRASSISLNWLGFVEPAKLTTLEDKSIGREHAPAIRKKLYEGELPDTFEDLLIKINARNELRSFITRQYLFEMKQALTEMARVTQKGGHIVLVTGNNQVCEEVLRNDEFTIQTLSSLGLKLELSLIDHIKSRGLMTKRNKTASVISRESVLVFSK